MLIECVPNFSEGRDIAVIEAIRQAIAAHLPILHVTSDRDHNRSVFSFAGSPQSVQAAVLAAAAVAVESIDLRKHSGVHPRIGAIDVIPLIPISDANLLDCSALARGLADALWINLSLPSFFYESAANGRGLEEVRRAARMDARPDTGTGRHPTAGVSAVGARPVLIAWNILLESQDLSLAKKLAQKIRFSSGGFPGVKALGLPLPEQHCVQVSINSTDYTATGLQVIFDAVRDHPGLTIRGAELIGLIPRNALQGTNLPWLDLSPNQILETALESLEV